MAELLRKNIWLLLLTLVTGLICVLIVYIMILQGSKDTYSYLLEHREEEIRIYVSKIEDYQRTIDNLHKINQVLISEINSENVKLLNIYLHMHTADKELANVVRLASKVTGVDELLLTALINTESAFVVGVKHSLDYVVGLGGINTKYWRYPVNTPEEQIFATALVLKKLLELSKGDYLNALHYYKGRSPLGLRQAEYVLRLYDSYKTGE